jgi:Flp pilus assembly protein TadD
LEIQPDNQNTCNTLAWVLATWPDAAVRNGVKAVALAEKADRLTGGTNPVIIETLAAAYAEAGRYSEAATAARKALQLVGTETNSPMVKTLQAQLGLSQAGQPVHNTAQTNALPDPSRP